VFDTFLLADRLVQATRWLRRQPEVAELPIGYFGASTGAAAALRAAAALGDEIAAVVSRGGRPDIAGASLAKVTAPTLLIVGGRDMMVLELNRHAQQARALRNPRRDRPAPATCSRNQGPSTSWPTSPVNGSSPIGRYRPTTRTRLRMSICSTRRRLQLIIRSLSPAGKPADRTSPRATGHRHWRPLARVPPWHQV